MSKENCEKITQNEEVLISTNQPIFQIYEEYEDYSEIRELLEILIAINSETHSYFTSS